MRDASNGKSIIRRIRHKAGLNLEIITGDEESQIIFDNHFNYIVNAFRPPTAALPTATSYTSMSVADPPR